MPRSHHPWCEIALPGPALPWARESHPCAWLPPQAPRGCHFMAAAQPLDSSAEAGWQFQWSLQADLISHSLNWIWNKSTKVRWWPATFDFPGFIPCLQTDASAPNNSSRNVLGIFYFKERNHCFLWDLHLCISLLAGLPLQTDTSSSLQFDWLAVLMRRGEKLDNFNSFCILTQRMALSLTERSENM